MVIMSTLAQHLFAKGIPSLRCPSCEDRCFADFPLKTFFTRLCVVCTTLRTGRGFGRVTRLRFPF